MLSKSLVLQMDIPSTLQTTFAIHLAILLNITTHYSKPALIVHRVAPLALINTDKSQLFLLKQVTLLTLSMKFATPLAPQASITAQAL